MSDEHVNRSFSARLDQFLSGQTFIVVTGNPAANRESEYEAWAYLGPLDFEFASPLCFGLGCSPSAALDALAAHLPAEETSDQETRCKGMGGRAATDDDASRRDDLTSATCIEQSPMSHSMIVLSECQRALLKIAIEDLHAVVSADSILLDGGIIRPEELTALASHIAGQRAPDAPRILWPDAVDLGEPVGSWPGRSASLVWNIETYNGNAEDLPEWSDAKNPVKVTYENGLRLILGEPVGVFDTAKPGVVIERQRGR